MAACEIPWSSMQPNEVDAPPATTTTVSDEAAAGMPDAEHVDPGSLGARPQHDDHKHPPANPAGRRLAVLTLTALGVVYGDIGTSPLYTMRETFSAEYGMVPNTANVYGILCLVFWSLALVVVFT